MVVVWVLPAGGDLDDRVGGWFFGTVLRLVTLEYFLTSILVSREGFVGLVLEAEFDLWTVLVVLVVLLVLVVLIVDFVVVGLIIGFAAVGLAPGLVTLVGLAAGLAAGLLALVI